MNDVIGMHVSHSFRELQADREQEREIWCWCPWCAVVRESFETRTLDHFHDDVNVRELGGGTVEARDARVRQAGENADFKCTSIQLGLLCQGGEAFDSNLTLPEAFDNLCKGLSLIHI